MITILTKPTGIHPLNTEWVKYYAGKITGKKRGPEMVARSLSRGLTELDTPHLLNPFFLKKKNKKNNTNIVHVIGGPKTLAWAINLKSRGKITQLITGPTISIVPEDNNSILRNPEIDTIVFPSKWTKDFFSSIDAYYENKIQIWPAGVSENVTVSNRKNNCGIVYFKFTPPEIRKKIMDRLSTQKINYKIFEYGSFKQTDFFSALEKADWMIYLSPSESQGIALQEAWIRNVPTLVWDQGVWNYESPINSKKYSWKSELISAPYLSPESGMTFKTVDDFEINFQNFLGKLTTFTPRTYCMKKLTDRESAARFLNILEIIRQK